MFLLEVIFNVSFSATLILLRTNKNKAKKATDTMFRLVTKITAKLRSPTHKTHPAKMIPVKNEQLPAHSTKMSIFCQKLAQNGPKIDLK